MTNSDAKTVGAIVLILRNKLDFNPLPSSVADNELKPHATALLKCLRAGYQRQALDQAIAKIQSDFRASINRPEDADRRKEMIAQVCRLIEAN